MENVTRRLTIMIINSIKEEGNIGPVYSSRSMYERRDDLHYRVVAGIKLDEHGGQMIRYRWRVCDDDGIIVMDVCKSNVISVSF